jgi:GTP-binding protein YchF
MKLGIVGLPNAGKTTVFNALTHAGALATAYAFSSAEANHGVVAVPDARLDRLNEVLQTPREVHATIEVVDIPGLAGGSEHGSGLGSRFLSDIREVDAVAHVVRAFDNPEVAFPRATIDPVADVEAVETELILSDLELIERRRDKTAKAVRAGDRQAQKEMVLLERFATELGEGRRAREIARGTDDEPLLRDLALVTERPVLFVLNADESHLDAGAALAAWALERGDGSVALAARLEVELAELEPDEAAEFRAELGVPVGGVDDLITGCYGVLGYITFFTGDFKSSESRAWQLPHGWTAWQAAGRIHGDIQKKFVRAEVVPIVDLLQLGSFAHARDKGVLRVEGRTYVVADGDVMNFRHTA